MVSFHEVMCLILKMLFSVLFHLKVDKLRWVYNRNQRKKRKILSGVPSSTVIEMLLELWIPCNQLASLKMENNSKIQKFPLFFIFGEALTFIINNLQIYSKFNYLRTKIQIIWNFCQFVLYFQNINFTKIFYYII